MEDEKLVKIKRRNAPEEAEGRPGWLTKAVVADTIRSCFLVLLLSSCLSKALYGNFFFRRPEAASVLPAAKDLWPDLKHVFSETELASYDGSDPTKPILIGLDGQVFDVTQGARFYGPSGSYSFMAGRDAARAFITGCFETHLTHDLRGLDAKGMKSLQSWKDFYRKSKKYTLVGRVVHAPIDPASPVPEDCKNAKAQKPTSKAAQDRPPIDQIVTERAKQL